MRCRPPCAVGGPTKQGSESQICMSAKVVPAPRGRTVRFDVRPAGERLVSGIDLTDLGSVNCTVRRCETRVVSASDKRAQPCTARRERLPFGDRQRVSCVENRPYSRALVQPIFHQATPHCGPSQRVPRRGRGRQDRLDQGGRRPAGRRSARIGPGSQPTVLSTIGHPRVLHGCYEGPPSRCNPSLLWAYRAVRQK